MNNADKKNQAKNRKHYETIWKRLILDGLWKTKDHKRNIIDTKAVKLLIVKVDLTILNSRWLKL